MLEGAPINELPSADALFLHRNQIVRLERMQTLEEQAQIARLDAEYEEARNPIVQAVTNDVCGCGYIGMSWTSRDESHQMLDFLGLSPADRLLDVGAGAGWPGLYFAHVAGCHLTLLDLPESGLRIARERAVVDGIDAQVQTVQGDAADMPLTASSMSAISHSDVLCCLQKKYETLAECRRVICDGGRMAFSVICIAPGLHGAELQSAIEAAPEFCATDHSYPEMLAATGWQLDQQLDITSQYAASLARMIAAERRQQAELRRLRGDNAYQEGQARWQKKHVAVQRHLVSRYLYFATPV